MLYKVKAVQTIDFFICMYSECQNDVADPDKAEEIEM